MVSRENKVIAAYLVATLLLLLFAVIESVSPPMWVSSAILLGLGVVAPTLTNAYLDKRAA